jgi:hypothetical protein
MGIDAIRTDPLFDPPTRYSDQDLSTSGAGSAPSPLDSDKNRQLHGKLMNSFFYEKRRQSINRYQMALDHDYYDSIQLTDEDVIELTDRGQPLYVYNLVKRTADWVIGTEKRTRIDFKVLARSREAAAVEAARNKTDLLKYLSDVNKGPFHRSQAVREAVISGLGWLEDGVRGDNDEEPIYSRKESWRNILHDSHSLELDGRDMMYLHRHKWVDLEVAVAMFPQRERQLEVSTIGAIQADDADVDEFYLGNRISGEDYLVGQVGRYPTATFNGFVDNTRDRVRLIETWYRKPVRDQIVLSQEVPQFHGLRFNPQNDDMRHAVIVGDASVVERVNMGVFYAIMTEGHLLAMGRSPYRHNQFPFTPIWCYRRGRDNAPYGLIRPIRDPQDGFNARMRKALFALSAYRVEGTSDAIDPKVMDWEDVRREAGRPDAMLIRKKGAELTVQQDRGLAEGHMKMAEMDASLILDSSGITADNLGMDSNAQSGKAIIAKQAEGSAVTAEIFDNIRLGYQLQGEKQLSLSEQYVTDEREVRITDAKGRPTWKKINQIEQLPDGSVRILNDITADKADFLIDQADFNVSLRQAASQQLFDFAGRMQGFNPMIVLTIIDMAIDQSNLPDKDVMLQRIRAITGFQPPEEALTPQEQAQQEQAKAQQQAQQQQQAEQAAAAANADIQEKLANAEKARAEAEKARAQAEQARAELPKGASVLTPEEQQRWDEITAAHEQAVKQVAQHTDTIAGLQQQLKDRSAEIEAERAAAMHKADQERAAAEHAATKNHDAAVRVAELENAPKPVDPTQAEAVADFQQTVHELSDRMNAIEEAIKRGEQVDEKERKEILDGVEKIVERATAMNAKAALAAAPGAAASQPAAPHELHITLNIDASGKVVKKTITLPNGQKATIEPEPPAK